MYLTCTIFMLKFTSSMVVGMVKMYSQKPKTTSRVVYKKIMHILVPPDGVATRWIGAMTLLVLALSRLGIIPSSIIPTAVPQRVYAVLMLIGCVTLLLTIPQRLTWYGRLIAAYGFALLGGFAIDILPAYTSALLMAIPAYALLGEVGVLDEC